MVTIYGMDEDFDFMQLEQIQGRYLGGERNLIVSGGTGNKIDEKVQSIINQAHMRAVEILKENMDKLHEISDFLLREETITGEEFMEILNRKEEDSVDKEEIRENTDVDLRNLNDSEVEKEDLPPISDDENDLPEAPDTDI